MVRDLPMPVGAGVYNVFTGEPLTGETHTGQPAGAPVPAAVRLGLEPPRFCAGCGRRMVVQIRPDGWWAECSRHGRVDSADLEAQR